MTGPADLPEAAGRRLGQGAWTSGLSTADLASCLALGAEPAGFVQGFCVMRFSTFMMGVSARSQMWGASNEGVVERFQCPHGYFGSADHRTYGFNAEQPWIEERWRLGWEAARSRMLEEVADLGAHGVVDVTWSSQPLAGTDAVEFRMQGTAVRVPGAPVPPEPFATTLSGQRLYKLLESGFAPVSVVGAVAAVLMYGYCITAWQLGGGGMGTVQGGAIEQVDRAQRTVRHMVRERIRARLGPDALHGATLEATEREAGEGAILFEVTMTGNRIRAFAPVASVPPEVVVTLR